MMPPGEVFHTGVVVADVDAAVVATGRSVGMRWAEIRDIDQPMWIPGHEPTVVPVRVTFSVGDGHRVELIEGPAGSLWDATARPGPHHVGVWEEDLVAATDAMEADGWQVVGAHKPRERGYGFAVYLSAVGFQVVELVHERIRPVLEEWWSTPAA